MSNKTPIVMHSVKKHLAQMRPYQTAKPLSTLAVSAERGPIVNLASNENPFTLPLLNSQMEPIWSNIRRYPDPTGIELRTLIANHLSREVDNITLFNGSSEAIAVLIQAFAGAGDEVIISKLGYGLYSTCIEIQGAQAVKVDDVNWKHDLIAMQATVSPATKMIIIANPNNPTGTYITHAELEKFLDNIPEHIVVVLDEAYYEYMTQADYPNSLELQKLHPNLVITRSFSKIYPTPMSFRFSPNEKVSFPPALS